MNLHDQYLAIRKHTVDLCAPLETEDYIPQPVEYVSPPKWNLGHTSWFFEELVLKKHFSNYQEFNPRFGFLFNSYYQSLGERTQRNQRGNLSRPTVAQVYEYRSYVDSNMIELLKGGDISEGIREIITIGLNHEQQHQELFLTDLKFTFSHNPLFPKYTDTAFCEMGGSDESGNLKIDKGVYTIGNSEEGFGYDNEYPAHKVYLDSFEIQKDLVKNVDYAAFIAADGYKKHEYWHDEAWKSLQMNKIEHPMYWQQTDGAWFQYTLAGLRKMIGKAPVTHLTYFEAYAYAQWRGMRLPTEFEWEIASEFFKWGDRWEWTESAYLPYPNYKKGTGAIGEYNGKFMVNQKVLRGASVATPEGHIQRNTYRNFFHPNLGYQFNGIRLAK